MAFLPHVSCCMQDIYSRAVNMASVNATLLILGETGTGKTILAELIHKRSNRADNSFVNVDCGSIPDQLIEAELFGFRRGAFTGANKDRQGCCQRAQGGTLFLDEIENLSLHGQTKLLGILGSRSVRPLGSSEDISLNIRFIVAANTALEPLVEENRFRKDLYYRVSTLTLTLPPLREHPEDIPAMLPVLNRHIEERDGVRAKPWSDDATYKAMQYSWPGNIRELYNRSLSASLHSIGDVVDPDDLFDDRSISKPVPMNEYMSKAKREYLQRILRYTGGSVSRAASIAGVDRKSMYRMLRKHDLR
jgi:transcriptional regulator with PAS, ATPase and Fis domain